MKTKRDHLKNDIAYWDNKRQFQMEVESWKQLLNSRMEENVLLKNKISDILKNNYDQNSLEEIEDFQTQFIREDELIHSLRRDINDLDNLQPGNLFEDGKIGKSVDKKMEDLRKDIANSRIRFRILKSTFDDFQYIIFNKRENQKL